MGKLSFNIVHKNLFNQMQEEQWKIGDFCHIDDWCKDPLTIVNMKQKFLRPGVAFDRCMQYALNDWKWDDKEIGSYKKVADLSRTEELGFGSTTNIEILTSCPRLSLMILEKI